MNILINSASTKHIGIIDYGSGNFTSVLNAVKFITEKIKIIVKSNDLDDCDKIILPGVGAFNYAMQKIRTMGIIEKLTQEIIDNKKPFLGICVGMQILAEKGYEFEETQGLNLVKGEVKKFNFIKERYILPHVGWNSVTNIEDNPLFYGIDKDDADFYFVHSYHLYSTDESVKFQYSEYGYRFISALWKDNFFGVQFHPEKSQHNGMKVLENFIKYA
jgi:glutamine amidotransferase